MRRLLLSTAAILLSAQVGLSLPASADYIAAETALQAGDIATAIPLLAEEAKLGNPVAAFNLAKIYEDGAAGVPDFTQAATYYRIAAEIDTAPRYNGAALGVQGPQLIAAAQKYGQFALGRLYESGKGVPQDNLEALAWYTRSADLGNIQARLGDAHRPSRCGNRSARPMESPQSPGRPAANQGDHPYPLHAPVRSNPQGGTCCLGKPPGQPCGIHRRCRQAAFPDGAGAPCSLAA